MIETNSLSILIVEDHALTRFGLKTALESQKYIKSINEVEDGESAIKLCKSECPDIVLMDLGLPGINGIDATKDIKKHTPDSKIIILTSHNNQEEVWACLKAGANAYCNKDIELERLLQVIESVYDGAIWFDPTVAEMILNRLSNDNNLVSLQQHSISKEVEGTKIQLTYREKEVLKLIVDGFSNAEIAEKLFVSIHTAKAHVCNILQKLSVDDRTQAAIKALKNGIV